MQARLSQFRPIIALPALLLALLLAPSGCAEIRLMTYPSEFVYLDQKGVQDAMHRMAGSLQTLDRIVLADSAEPGDPVRQAAIEKELQQLDARATALAVGSQLEIGDSDVPRTNHLLIDSHIDAFLSDIARARRFAALQPPNYYPVGTLVGGCNACHARY